MEFLPELRPAFLGRTGLNVEVVGSSAADQAVLITERCALYGAARAALCRKAEDTLVSVAALANLEDGQKGFLGDIDAADALHALLAFFLLLQQLAFA
jgi:hypothetical protein